MNRMLMRYAMFCATACLVFVIAVKAFGATNHVIVAHSNLTWTYNAKTSSPTQPLMVDDLQKGDTVEVQVPGGTHGFVTIKRAPDGMVTEITDPVMTCKDTPATKPNAVLQEIGCQGTATNFDVTFVGSLKLLVLDKFTNPVDFYCVQHKGRMPGTLKLSSAR